MSLGSITNSRSVALSRLVVAVAGVWALAGFAGCEGERPAPAAAPEVVVAAPKRPTVVFLTARGEVPVLVDVARTAAEREKGLMFVEHLPAGRGMLFLMGPERILTFWMKNTYIPLDMVFVNAALEVVGVVAKAEPLTLSPRNVDKPSSYVVEVPGGWAEKVGVVAGVKVRFESVD